MEQMLVEKMDLLKVMKSVELMGYEKVVMRGDSMVEMKVQMWVDRREVMKVVVTDAR